MFSSVRKGGGWKGELTLASAYQLHKTIYLNGGFYEN
jgi:hypothetical protein